MDPRTEIGRPIPRPVRWRVWEPFQAASPFAIFAFQMLCEAYKNHCQSAQAGFSIDKCRSDSDWPTVRINLNAVRHLTLHVKEDHRHQKNGDPWVTENPDCSGMADSFVFFLKTSKRYRPKFFLYRNLCDICALIVWNWSVQTLSTPFFWIIFMVLNQNFC